MVFAPIDSVHPSDSDPFRRLRFTGQNVFCCRFGLEVRADVNQEVDLHAM